MILGADARRLGIYFLYDADGVVDDATWHMLAAMHAHCHELIAVVNGSLTATSRARLESLERTTVIQRPNEGFDVWAYRTALRAKGWDEIARFDEVVLFNFTILGPVRPLDEMFARMDATDLDFWGLTTHNGASFDPFSAQSELGYLPVHLQSHFIAVRRPMATSQEFRDYWEHMVPIRSYGDAVTKHEVVFTKRFAELGFRWTSYVDTAGTIGRQYYPLFNQPVHLLDDLGCPVFKRKSFFAGPAAYLDETSHGIARGLYDHLGSHTQYDRSMLLRHLLRTCDVADLHATLALHEVIEPRQAPSGVATRAYVDCGSLHADDAIRAAHAAGVEEVVALCSTATRVHACEDASRTVQHDGDVIRAALADVTDAPADAVCLVLGPADGVAFPFSAPEAAARGAIEDLLASREHVAGILALLVDGSDTGVVAAAPPLHATWFGALGDGWRERFERVRRAFEADGRDVPMRAERDPISMESGAFWFRPDALDGAARLDLEAHEILIALPSLAAANGALTRHATTARRAGLDLATAVDYLRRLGAQVGGGSGERFSALLHRLSQMATVGHPGHHARSIVAFSISWDLGGPHRVAAEHVAFVTDGGAARVTLVPPANAASAQLDPVDGARVLCARPRVQGATPLDLRIDGAVERDGELLLDGDAFLRITGELREGEPFTIELDRLRLEQEGPAIADALVDQGSDA